MIHSLIVYDGKNKRVLKSSVRYSTKSLHFLFYSMDNSDGYKVAPVASFHPKLPEGLRFYTLQSTQGVLNSLDQGIGDNTVVLDDVPSFIQDSYDDILYIFIFIYTVPNN